MNTSIVVRTPIRINGVRLLVFCCYSNFKELFTWLFPQLPTSSSTGLNKNSHDRCRRRLDLPQRSLLLLYVDCKYFSLKYQVCVYYFISLLSLVPRLIIILCYSKSEFKIRTDSIIPRSFYGADLIRLIIIENFMKLFCFCVL